MATLRIQTETHKYRATPTKANNGRYYIQSMNNAKPFAKWINSYIVSFTMEEVQTIFKRKMEAQRKLDNGLRN